MFAPPLNDVAVPVTSPLMAIVLAVCNVVAVDALPVNAAVIVPAEKLPLASLATTLDAVFALVASTFRVTSPDVPPPVKKLPAVTDVISPAEINANFETIKSESIKFLITFDEFL